MRIEFDGRVATISPLGAERFAVWHHTPLDVTHHDSFPLALADALRRVGAPWAVTD